MAQKILIADDDPLMHQLYGHHLERAGYQLLVATDGREAVEVAAREHPQLIVMDVLMAGLDGFGAVREIKKRPATRTIPIIMITASVETFYTTRQEAKLAGADGFLTKPFSPARLLEEIRRLMPVTASAPGPTPS